jgi:hypothetical protein
MCAGNTVEQNRTADVHNLSERVSLKSDTVCGNTQDSPLLFFVFSMASACMFCLASRTQYLLCYGDFVFHSSCGQVEIGI